MDEALKEATDLWQIVMYRKRYLGMVCLNRGLNSPTWKSSWKGAGKKAEQIIKKILDEN